MWEEELSESLGRETGELSTSLEAMAARIVKNLWDLGYD